MADSTQPSRARPTAPAASPTHGNAQAHTKEFAAKATTKVPGGLQLVFEVVIEQIERQVERKIGIRTTPFVVPLAVSLFFSSLSQIGWRSFRTPGKNTSDHRPRM